MPSTESQKAHMKFRLALFVGLAFLSGCSSTPSSSESKDAFRRPANAVVESVVSYATRLEEVDPDFVESASPDEIKAVEALIKMLSLKVNVVQKDFTLYHYAPPDQVKPKSLPANASDPAGFRLFRSKVDKFWSNRWMGSMNGNGLYLAVDPASTQDYRKSDGTYLLLVVTARKGMRILDKDAFEKRYSRKNDKRLSALGCDYETSSYSTFATSEKCGKYLKIAMKALRISLVEYDYKALLECQERRTAFVAVDSTLFTPKDVKLLMTFPNFEDAETEELAWKTYSLSAENFPSWSEKFKNRSALNQQELQDLRNATLLSCPSVKDHLASAVGLSHSEIVSLRQTNVKWIALNRNLPVPGVYCGRPLIHIKSVKYAKPGTESFQPAWSLGDIEKFCNGSATCSYSKQFLGECRSQGSCGSMEVKWSCVPSCGKEDTRSEVFDLSQASTLEISCEDTEGQGSDAEKSIEE